MDANFSAYQTHARTSSVAAAFFLAAFLAGCGQSKPNTSAPQQAPAAAPAPQTILAPQSIQTLKVAADAGKLTLTGTVSSEELRKQLRADAINVVGAGNVVDQLTVDPGAPNPVWLEQAATLFAWLKPGKPLAISGDASYVTLEGMVPTAAEKTERGRWANAFFGNTITVTNSLQVRS
jgi:BON domain